jgi:transposase
MPYPSPYQIELSDVEREELERLARKYTAPYQDVVRAKIVLLASEGYTNTEIAARLDLPRQIVSRWRQRYFFEREAGLKDRKREGRKPSFSP